MLVIPVGLYCFAMLSEATRMILSFLWVGVMVNALGYGGGVRGVAWWR